MSAQTCAHCGRRVGHAALVEAYDPWDNKLKWVCIDADTCAAGQRDRQPK